jgi:predicted cupin superfamily sugar epimerase
MSQHNSDYWIQHLKLQPHPEGGAYARVYTAELIIPQKSLPENFSGDRNSCTHIYYLLRQNDFSAFHRIQSDELWHFYDGDTLCIYEIDKHGELTEHLLGKNSENGEAPFHIIKAGNWFASKLKTGGSYALVGCTVSPGFDFAEFEMGDRNKLIKSHPQYADLISSLTR